MASKEKQIENWKKGLTDLKLMEENDEVLDFVQANWYEKTLKVMGTWQKGNLVFTEKRVIFTTAFAGSKFSLEYKDIKDLKKCSVSFLPLGLIITAYDKEKDKTIQYKCSLTKRNNWLEFIANKANLSLETK